MHSQHPQAELTQHRTCAAFDSAGQINTVSLAHVKQIKYSITHTCQSQHPQAELTQHRTCVVLHHPRHHWILCQITEAPVSHAEQGTSKNLK